MRNIYLLATASLLVSLGATGANAIGGGDLSFEEWPYALNVPQFGATLEGRSADVGDASEPQAKARSGIGRKGPPGQMHHRMEVPHP